MEKKPVVKLRAYRGKEMNYTKDGVVKNENNIVSLIHGTKQWSLFMKNLPINGYCRVDVEGVFIPNFETNEYDREVDVSKYKEEVDGFFTPKSEVKLSASDQRIAELEAKLELLLKNQDGGKKEAKQIIEKVKSEAKEVKTKEVDDTDSLVNQYTFLSGKKPHHMWKEDTLREKIEELKS
jgi:hypothetical protein